MGAAAAAPSAGAPSAAPVNGRILDVRGPRHERSLLTIDLAGRLSVDLLPFAGDVVGSYSPDGTQIVFASNLFGDAEIYVVNADGTGFRQLTTHRDGDFDIYINGSWDIWIADARGWPLGVQVTNGLGTDWFDDWSPDGKWFVVESNEGGDYNLWRYEFVPGGGIVAPSSALTSDGSAESFARFAPDGSKIAFSSNRDGDFEIYTMKLDGSPDQQLTYNTLDDFVVDWQPLFDVRPPVVHALPGKQKRGSTLRLGFTASDDSGRASVEGYVLAGRRFAGYFHTESTPRTAGRVYTARARALKSVLQSSKGPLKFCARAYDPSGNESKLSCSRIGLR